MLDAGIRGIERFLEEYKQTEKSAQVGELTFLRRWKEEILAKIEAPAGTEIAEAAETTLAEDAKPVDRVAELRAQIDLAIAEERYEEAAVLRDELSRLKANSAGENDSPQ